MTVVSGHVPTGLRHKARLICGEHDEAQPATGRRYAGAMPQGEFAEIRGASHAILAEQPRRLVRTIGRFLERND